jgi:outer membrane protein OmpA-like peptidoglycan-associated protein
MRLFIAAACLFVLVALAIGVGLAYVGYIAKKRVTAAQQAYKHDDLGGMIAAVAGKSNKPQPLPDWKPAPAELLSAETSKIPLRKSLRLVNAGSDVLLGDFESIYVVDNVTDQMVHIHGSRQFPPGQGIERFLGGGSAKTQKSRKIECGRTDFAADLENSTEADGYLCRDGREDKHPGRTAMSLSRKVLNELRSTGQAEFTYHEDPLKAVLKSFKKAMASDSKASSDAASADLVKKMMDLSPVGGGDDSTDTPPLKCTLRRDGTTDVAFPVLVNDQPVELPAINIVVKLPDKEGHLYVLDDPDNPLFLAAASTEGGHEQIIKIYWDFPKRTGLEEELTENGRAKVYDLYFDFRSDELRPESNKVLKEIAEVMRAHPDWKLSVEGNTDNIGGDAYNLDLSNRRAAAVKQALVTQYGVAADRLSSAGFGSSHPIDTNDTFEGRSRNRRVELARQ